MTFLINLHLRLHRLLHHFLNHIQLDGLDLQILHLHLHSHFHFHFHFYYHLELHWSFFLFIYFIFIIFIIFYFNFLFQILFWTNIKIYFSFSLNSAGHCDSSFKCLIWSGYNILTISPLTLVLLAFTSITK